MATKKRSPRKSASRKSATKARPPLTPGRVLLKLVKWLFILGLLAALAGVGTVAGIFYYYGRDLPEIFTRDDFKPQQISRVYAAGGEMIGEFYFPGGRRTVVPLEEIPAHVQHAFMAAEDADFMIHSGVDYVGLARAFYNAARHDTGMKGTSTITQQVVKNLVLTPEKSLERKIQEIILSWEIEKNLTKHDILFMYLNTIYLGHGNNGVEEAAQYLFGKSVRELDIPQAALLAGMTQSPERLTPVRHPEAAKKRRSYVLRQMWEKGFIEEAAYRAAEASEIVVVDVRQTFPHRGKAPYFVEYIRKDLIARYGEAKVFTGGLRVHTTLDLRAQEAAEASVRAGLREYDGRQKFYRPTRKLAEKDIDGFLKRQADKAARTLDTQTVFEAVVVSVDAEREQVELRLGEHRARLELEPRSRIFGEGKEAKGVADVFQKGHVVRVTVPQLEPGDGGLLTARFEVGPEAALIALDPHTREVVALVGGYDFAFNKYDHATQARRQTGSSYKSIVYGAALEQKINTPATVYLDSPTVFQMPGGKSWSPKNADNQWRGPIRVREALAASRNVVAVRVLDDVGIPQAIEFSRKIGVKSPLVDNYTMVMGSSEMPPIELTNAYATFAAGGMLGEPRFLRRVESVAGEREEFTSRLEPVIAPEVAYTLTSLLESAVSGYVDSTGRRRGGTADSLRQLGHPIAGKTGTTNEARDAWFIGYTPDLVVGVWAGFSEPRPLGNREYGGRVAVPIFREFMRPLLHGKEPRPFERPATGLTTAHIDPASGKLARTGGIEEIFLVGTAPTDYAASETDTSVESFIFDQFSD